MIKFKLVTICVGAAMYFASCGGNINKSAGDTSKMNSFGLNSNSNVFTGAGSAAVSPLLGKLFAEYGKNDRIRVNYQSIGQQNGITALTKKTMDFAVTDVPLTARQSKLMSIATLQVPCFSSPGGVTRIIIYKEQGYDGRSLQRAEKLLNMLWWDIHDGQKYGSLFNYTPLSTQEVINAEKILKSATFNGKPLLP